MKKNIQIADEVFEVSSDDEYLNLMGRIFEPHMVELFRSLVNEGDIVIDVGANIGMTSMLFSQFAQRVYAFEPSPSTFNYLKENIEDNDCSNVELFNYGLGDKAETLTITFSQDNRSGGYVSEKIRPQQGHVTEEIEVVTIDQYFIDHEIKANFIKIDVEGYELNVLKGGAEYIEKYKPTVVLEMNHFCLNVLQRITMPEFMDCLCSIFPYLFAVDSDNKQIISLESADSRYHVMHEHVVKNRFPNIVGSFNDISHVLDQLRIRCDV
jgi:FkbM family methyltransferase